MFEYIAELLDSEFMPHGHCYQWQSDIVWLHAGSDALIASSYYAIPFLLIYFLSRRRDIAFPRMFVMFGAFILLCGTTHLLEIWSIWNGTYRLTGAVKLVTGVVSAATAVMLFVAVPKALAIPSPRQLEEVNASLRGEIEARRRAEVALRESEERFREAFDHSAVGKGLVDTRGRWLQVNDALCEMSGYNRDELLRLRFQDITPPEDVDEDIRQVKRMIAGEIRSYQTEKRYLRKDGSLIWVVLVLAGVRNDEGELSYFIAEVQDITERKRWQLEQQHLLAQVEDERDKLRDAERQLEEANEALKARNVELQEFAYMAAHDLQEPLRKVVTFADLLVKDCSERLDESARQYVDRIQHASLRMLHLLTDLLKYSRVTTHAERFTAVDLNDVLRDVVGDLELAVAKARAEVSWSRLPVIEADPLQMHQLFNNLVANSIKYARDGEAPFVKITAEAESDDTVTIVVEDNGMGFESRYAQRIFRPFERLHGQRYGGTGMGLAICKRIVERLGGAIHAEGRPGEGARFTVRLPRDGRRGPA